MKSKSLQNTILFIRNNLLNQDDHKNDNQFKESNSENVYKRPFPCRDRNLAIRRRNQQQASHQSSRSTDLSISDDTSESLEDE